MPSAMKLLSRLPILKSANAPRWPYRVKRQASTESALNLDFLDYEAICKNTPEHFNFARDILDQWSQKEKDGKRPPNPALWWIDGKGKEVRWTFEELGFLSRKAANVLLEHCKLNRGDRVVLILPRVPEWWLITVGCMRTDIIFIPATVLLTAKDILYRFQISKAKCIVTNDAIAPLVDSVASKCHSLKSRMLVSKGGSREGWLNFHDLLEAASSQHEPVNTKSQDPISFYFTSGTTGYPKMVEHTSGNLGMGLIHGGRHWMNLVPSSLIWGLSDTGWVKFVFSSLYSPWIQGSCIFSHSMPQFDPPEVLKTLDKYPVTTFCGTPTIFRMLLQQDLSKYKFKSLTTCLSGGEPLNTEVMEQWKAQTGLDIYEGYGQTESTLICGTMKSMKVKPGFIGKPCPPYDVKIIDEHCNLLPAGKEGDIAVRIKPKRPLGLFSRYVDDPEKTASMERGDFYLTGDRGIMDEEGYIQFVGRADDVILSSGGDEYEVHQHRCPSGPSSPPRTSLVHLLSSWLRGEAGQHQQDYIRNWHDVATAGHTHQGAQYRIGPFEVEFALMEHPAVAESAVVSSPDPIRGEVVKAFIILNSAYESHDKDKLILELQEHVKRITAPYKYPRKIEFVQELPKTISGKVQRNLLRKKEWEKAQ